MHSFAAAARSGCPFEMGSSSLMRGTCDAMLAHACVVVVRAVRSDRGYLLLRMWDHMGRLIRWSSIAMAVSVQICELGGRD